MSVSRKITWRSEGAVAVLALEDGKANTFDLATFQALEEALTQVAVSPAGALVVTGRPGFFSAGLDLKLLPTLPHAELVETIRAFGRALLQLFMFPRPVVAAVSGHALGAGAMLALAADVRVGAEGAFRFGLNEVPIGMVVPTFGVEIARAAVSPALLTELLLHGRVFSPRELHSHGVVEALVTQEAVLAAALKRAEGLAALPSHPYAQTKVRLRGQAAEWAGARVDQESEELVQGMALG